MNKGRMVWLPVLLLLMSGTVFAQGKSKQTAKGHQQVVDSGSFGVFVNGRRIATESFTIKQSPDASIATSQFKLDDGSKAAQTSELILSPRGELRRYEWKETGTKLQAVLEPQNEFLIERITGGDKPLEQPYLMPHTTMVLDDYFFSHREILAWKYLATSCQPKPGEQGCAIPKAQYGIVIPRQRTSSMVTLEYAGRDRVQIRGVERDLNRIELQSEIGNWSLWFDDQHKLVRILIPSDSTEVVRD